LLKRSAPLWRDSCFQFLDFAVLFKELVKEAMVANERAGTSGPVLDTGCVDIGRTITVGSVVVAVVL
jgi:hypothetical protein